MWPVLGVILAATASALGTPYWIRLCKEREFLAPDIHKAGRATAVKVGSIPFIAASLAALGVSGESSHVVASIAAVVLLGIVDDLVSLGNLEKIVIPALVMSTLPIGGREVLGVLLPAPLWGALFGTFVVNASNTLAGFNGLEAGCFSIASIFLAIHSAISGDVSGSLAYVALAGACIPFLTVNWYPAKAFPGNCGTFFMGASLAAISISRGADWPLLILYVPHGLDFTLKLLGWGKTKKKGRASVGADGKLHPPPHLSLAGLLLRIRPMSEERLVTSLLALEVAVGIASFFLPPLVHAPA